MKSVVRGVAVFLPACALLLSGCGESGPPRADAHGKVMVDGEPVAEGAIIFIPVEGVSGPPTQLDIKEGVYSTVQRGKRIVVGTSSVYISGVKTTGRKVRDSSSGELNDEYVEIVPRKYNEQSELQVEVQEGDNTFDFELEGKPQR